MDQKLEEEYKKLYPEEDFMQIEKFEQNLDNDETRINLFEDVYDNKEAPNEEDNKEVAFHDNYDNEETFIYDNEQAFIYDNENDFQSESEFDEPEDEFDDKGKFKKNV